MGIILEFLGADDEKELGFWTGFLGQPLPLHLPLPSGCTPIPTPTLSSVLPLVGVYP